MKTTTLLAATIAAVLLAGCDKETVNLFLPAEGQIIATDADSVAYPVTNNWNEPSLFSINAIKARHCNEMQAFRCLDGAGLLAWREGRVGTGKSFLFLAYYGPDGDMMPAVEILGDFQDQTFLGMEDLAIVWTPGGDAVIAFRAEQAEDPTIADDNESMRVYYTWFRRAYAELPLGPTGEIYGFRQWAEPVDTNEPGTDDNRVDRIFVATNLADGTIKFDTEEREASPLSELCTGSRGDTCNGMPFIYLGWVREEAENDARRLEGGLIDLGTLAFTNAAVSVIETNPPAGPDDSVDDWSVHTSGRDIAFVWTRYLDTKLSDFQRHLNLARINDTRDGLRPTIDIGRGAQTSTRSYIDRSRLIGNGYRVLNGSDATWFIFEQSRFTSDSVTNEDKDLLVAQVDATGNVEIGEFDHNPVNAPEENWVDEWEIQLNRGATRAFFYYLQATEVAQTSTASDSLFARAVRLDADAALDDNVSNEVRVNSTLDVTIPRTTNVWGDFYLAKIDPFCTPQTNNDVSCVVFRQSIEPVGEGELDYSHFQVLYGRVAIMDIAANPIAITATDAVIFPKLDEDIEANDPEETPPPVMLPLRNSNGDYVVFLTANGNHADDGNHPDLFDEARLFAYAPALGGTVEIGSNNPAGPTLGFADYAVLDHSESYNDDARNVMGVATPNLAAARDCRFSNDVANPDFAHVFFFEYLRDPSGGRETIWRSRVLDLRGGASFAPPLRDPPARIGTGYNAALFRQMVGTDDDEEEEGGMDGPYFVGATQKNDLFVAFNEVWGRKADPGFIFCNTFDPEAVLWARASLLSNDYPSPIASHGSPDMIFVPGVDAAGCDRIVGGWVFWIRTLFQPDKHRNDVDLLQGRRLYDTRMER